MDPDPDSYRNEQDSNNANRFDVLTTLFATYGTSCNLRNTTPALARLQHQFSKAKDFIKAFTAKKAGTNHRLFVYKLSPRSSQHRILPPDSYRDCRVHVTLPLRT